MENPSTLDGKHVVYVCVRTMRIEQPPHELRDRFSLLRSSKRQSRKGLIVIKSLSTVASAIRSANVFKVFMHRPEVSAPSRGFFPRFRRNFRAVVVIVEKQLEVVEFSH